MLFNDSAVAGEAAALAIGLVMLGSANPKAIAEMPNPKPNPDPDPNPRPHPHPHP